jgi:hypothetical protein
MNGSLFPTRPRLQPEDCCGDGFPTFTGRLAVEAFGDPCSGLDAAALKLMSVGRLEVLFVCGEDAGNVGRRKPEAGEGLYLGAQWPVTPVASNSVLIRFGPRPRG